LRTGRRSIGVRAGQTSTSSGNKRRKGRSGGAENPSRPERIRPTKALGQHFLSDPNILSKIVAESDLGPDDIVVEVGPGMGELTAHLAEAAGWVIAVEVDHRLCERLRQRFADSENVSIVEADVLDVDPGRLLAECGIEAGADYVVVGNLPYNIGAAILRHFLEATRPPRLIVMLQREVAASITAMPGKLGLLGVGVQVYARPRRLFNVAPGAFRPPPKVVSTVIRLDTRAVPRVPLPERDAFFQTVRAGFSAPRKQLHNTLAQGLDREDEVVTAAIEGAGLDATRRPEELSIEDWLKLSRALAG
jgi:16S rRNA (adenine1518-N6/adenine1519-N6)-dimethyltransferase